MDPEAVRQTFCSGQQRAKHPLDLLQGRREWCREVVCYGLGIVAVLSSGPTLN